MTEPQPLASAAESAATSAPDLSIVVVAFVGQSYLERLLAALATQTTDAHEVIVACDALIRDADVLRARYPRITFLVFPERRTPAELRAAGVRRATGRVVALLEDHCIPTPTWSAAVIRAHATWPAATVGGVIEKGFAPGARSDSALNWALYLADYSRYAPPLEAGPAAGASDCNVSYKHDALSRIASVWKTEFHENVVHDALARGNETVWRAPDMLVYEHRGMTWGSTLRDRFTFGRLFGATRATTAPFPRRIAMAVAALLIPPLQVVRVARNVAARPRYVGAFAWAVIPLTVVASAWALGEGVGYVTGRAGASLAPRR